MKFISAILLLLFTFVVSGCGENLDGDPHYSYELKVKIIDKFGNNLIGGIECEDIYAVHHSNPYPEDRFIARHLYTYVIQTANPDIGIVYIMPYLHYVVIDGEAYLNFSFSSLLDPQSSISFNFQCEEIFGNKKEHEIVAYFSNRYSNLNQPPTRVTFDGVDQKIGENAQITITIDK